MSNTPSNATVNVEPEYVSTVRQIVNAWEEGKSFEYCVDILERSLRSETERTNEQDVALHTLLKDEGEAYEGPELVPSAELVTIDAAELAALRKDRASLNSMATLLADARRQLEARAVKPHRSGGPVAPDAEPAFVPSSARRTPMPASDFKLLNEHQRYALYAEAVQSQSATARPVIKSEWEQAMDAIRWLVESDWPDGYDAWPPEHKTIINVALTDSGRNSA